MKRIIVLISLFLVFTAVSSAQNAQEDLRIDRLLQLHIAYNIAFPVMTGYRIQLFMQSGNKALEKAEEITEKFQGKYDKVPAYITFGEPYYRVRIGDFRSRLEAIKFLNTIARNYPQAWVVKDKINFPSLPKTQKTYQYE